MVFVVNFISRFLLGSLAELKLCALKVFYLPLNLFSVAFSQGSVLGPLLFILFINDLIDTIPPEAHPTFFADDLKIYSDLPVCLTTSSPGSAYCPLIRLSQPLLSNWSKLWQLISASKKCSCLSISNKKFRISMYVCTLSTPCPFHESNPVVFLAF